MAETLHQKIQESPYKNIYWFARYLLNTDEYGAIGRNKEEAVLEIVSLLETLLIQEGLSDEEKLKVLKDTLEQHIISLSAPGTKAYSLTNNLATTFDKEINSIEDIVIFCITMKYVVAPINHAISFVPDNDKKFCDEAAKSILDSLGETKAGTVISTWDKLGVKGCLDAERTIVVEQFSKLIENIAGLEIDHCDLDDNLLLTAFIQEFERRLGQKRKNRGGTSLETVVDFLFNYYGFHSSEAPSHFDQDIEVDKWFKCAAGWKIGISCKRTLRERWKQLSQADRGTLSHFKIKELWHIITFDRDLSDDKIVRLGEQGQLFYLLDDSEVYLRCKDHPGMRDYVRPLSHLISDIRTNIRN